VLGRSLLEAVIKLQPSDFKMNGEIGEVHFYAIFHLGLGSSSVSSVVFVSINVFIESSHILLKLLVLLYKSSSEISFQFTCEFSLSSYSS